MSDLSKTGRARLRITNDDPIVGRSTRVFLGEQDVTAELHVTRITADLKVGAVARVNLECICWGVDLDAALDDLVIQHVGRSRVRRAMWRFRKWWWGISRRNTEITAAGDANRSWVR